MLVAQQWSEAAAKNYNDVTVVTSSKAQYNELIDEID